MTSTIYLPNARFFAAALTCVSNEETRYYLNGVFLQPAIDGGVLLTATDGHRLFHGHQYSGAPVKPFHPVIVRPVGKLALPAKWTPARGDGDSLAIDVAAGVMRCGNDAAGITVIDGTFPDYSRFFPALPLSGEPAQFNARYLADFDKAGAALTGNRPGFNFEIAHNGDGPAMILFPNEPNAFGVLMPVRSNLDKSRRPDLPRPMDTAEINAALSPGNGPALPAAAE